MSQSLDRGLCATCVHAQVVTNALGSTFSLCKMSFVDPHFRKYPPLPVRYCDGYVGHDATEQPPPTTSHQPRTS